MILTEMIRCNVECMIWRRVNRYRYSVGYRVMAEETVKQFNQNPSGYSIL